MTSASIDVREDLVRRLAAATRGARLYAPDHPIVARGVDALAGLCTNALQRSDSIVVGVVGDEIVVDGERLQRPPASLVGFARDLRAQNVDRITLGRGITRDDLRSFVSALAERSAAAPLARRVEAKQIRGVTLGRIRDEEGERPHGIAAARRVYARAVRTARSLWDQARSGDKPDPHGAWTVVDCLATLMSGDHRTSILALTTVNRHSDYTFTFTHMVNVSVLAMALARSLRIEGPLLREFGFAALMHDIGKVNTPDEVLNKPGRLTAAEFDVMKRHVIDGAHILRSTPGTPALAPVVAFEHHLGQDLSGYPENVGPRELNLCTQIVSIADVYDALRSHRVYREGLPSERVRTIMATKDSPAFNPKLLRRFINLVGLFPVGTLVRLGSGEIAVVSREHPCDPYRPQVKVLLDREGDRLHAPEIVNTWQLCAADRMVVEAVDPESVRIDPLEYLS